MSLTRFSEKRIHQILSTVSNAVVFVDTAAAECLHWSNGVDRLLTGGALDIRDLNHSKECIESETKGVFIITSPLSDKVHELVADIVQNSDFEHCTVICAVSPGLHEVVTKHPLQGTQSLQAYAELSRKLKLWMGNEYSTADVRHIPIFHAQVLNDTFVTPAHGDIFPPLPSDISRLQGFLHSQGDKRNFNHFGDVDIGLLPHNLQCKIKMLAASLNGFFEYSNFNEDCYGVGHFSNLVASELASSPSAKARRKMATTRASIVFVDRTLDLAGPVSHNQDSLLDVVLNTLDKLPGHQNDVSVDVRDLFAKGNVTPDTLFPGCLAHAGDAATQDILNSFVMKRNKDAIKELVFKLRTALKREGISFEKLDQNPHLEQLKHYLKYFRCDVKLFQKYSGLLQCAQAVLNALSSDEMTRRDELLSAEKVIKLGLFENESSTPLLKILSLISRKTDHKFSVVDAISLCLYVYSLAPAEEMDANSDKEKLKEAIIKILRDGEHAEDLLFLLGDPNPSEKAIRLRIADIFERFDGLSQAKAELRQLRSLVSVSDGQVAYKSLISQMMELILHPDRPDLVDIEFRSHGFKDFIKTGFGLFMNVAKPRPDDHPVLIVFVIGGITFQEIRHIREISKQLKPNLEVIIGSTRIITQADILEQVLCQDNLFVEME